MKNLIIVFMIASCISRADTDKVAHFGTSYALQTVTYGFYRKAFRMEKKPALIFATFATILIGVAKEYTDRKIDGGDIGANVLGSAAATGTILMFDF